MTMGSNTERKFTEELAFKSPRGLSLKAKLNLPVSGDGSVYGDDTWEFLSEFLQDNVRESQTKLRWAFKLGNATFLDNRFDDLRESSKDFMLSLRLRPTRRGQPMKASSLLRVFRDLKAVIRWMASKNITSFSALTPALIEDYVAHVRTTRNRAKPLNKGSVQKRFELLVKLYEQRGHVAQPLDFHPFQGQSSFAVSGLTKEDQRANKFDHIPDEVAIDLAEKALDLVQKQSERIVSAYLAGKLAYDDAKELGRSKPVAERRQREAIKEYGYEKIKQVTRDMGDLRTACYIVIAFFSGIRDSEMSSIDRNCIEVDEENCYIWLHGKSFKIAHNGISPRWMVPPVVKKAVNVLEQLSSWLQKTLQAQITVAEQDLQAEVIGDAKREEIEKELTRMRRVQNRLFLVMTSRKGNTIDVLKSHGQALKEFVERHDVVKHQGEMWNLHPHQFRRTFVRFMVKNAMNIRYLQHHFKHISLDMTAWYDVDDVELVNEIADFHKEFTGEKLRGFLDADQLAGAGGDVIEERRKDYFAGLMAEDREQIIENMAETVTLRSTGVSWCLGDTEVGECSGVHGCMVEPHNVTECSQAVVTPEFLPAWEEMEQQNEELLGRDDLGTHQKEAIDRFLQGVIKPTLTKLRGDNA